MILGNYTAQQYHIIDVLMMSFDDKNQILLMKEKCGFEINDFAGQSM